MRKKTAFLYIGIVALCFWYTGSVYMSQFYRLMDFYDGKTVDVITSGWNYLLQAVGIGCYMIGAWKSQKVFKNKMLFIFLLVFGAIFMLVAQISNTGVIILLSGYVFQLHIGVYFGFYLTMFAEAVPASCSGLCYGAAYAVGSVGTYLISLLDHGDFLVSKSINVFYFGLAIATAVLVSQTKDSFSEADSKPDLNSDAKKPEKRSEKDEKNPAYRLYAAWIRYHIGMVAVMMVISVVGSGLYYSLPQAQDINWNLIRAFYAVGLILAGFIMDRSRTWGTLCVIASLTYPLIMTALIGDGVSNTVAMAISYAFRGFLTVYYVIAFTDLKGKDESLLILAPLGILISRVTESLLSFVLLNLAISETVQLILCAACFVPLLFLFYRMQGMLQGKTETDEGKRNALFAEKYKLTARETQVLKYLAEGLSDSEIADQCFISRNTVRFHVSNILKKTGTATRVEAVRELEKF